MSARLALVRGLLAPGLLLIAASSASSCKGSAAEPGVPTPQFAAGQEKFQAAVARRRDASRLLQDRQLDDSAKAYLAAVGAVSELCDAGIPGTLPGRGPVYDAKFVSDWREVWITSFRKEAAASYPELEKAVSAGQLDESKVRDFYQGVDPAGIGLRWPEGSGTAGAAEARPGRWVVGCASHLPCSSILSAEVVSALTAWVGGKLEVKSSASVTEAEADQHDGWITISVYDPPHRYRVDQTGMPLVDPPHTPKLEPEKQLNLIVGTAHGFQPPAGVGRLSYTIPAFPLDSSEDRNEAQRVSSIQKAILDALKE